MVLYCQFGKKISCSQLLDNSHNLQLILYQWPNTEFRMEHFSNPGHTNFWMHTNIWMYSLLSYVHCESSA